MKKVIRVLLILVVAFVALFTTISVANMILESFEIKDIVYGTGTGIIIIAMCIAFFVLLGKKKND